MIQCFSKNGQVDFSSEMRRDIVTTDETNDETWHFIGDPEVIDWDGHFDRLVLDAHTRDFKSNSLGTVHTAYLEEYDASQEGEEFE